MFDSWAERFHHGWSLNWTDYVRLFVLTVSVRDTVGKKIVRKEIDTESCGNIKEEETNNYNFNYYWQQQQH